MRAIVLCLLLSSCAGRAAGPVGPPERAPATAPLVLDRALVPEGAVLDARADQTVATEYSKPGQQITATVETPILDRRGGRALAKGTQVVLRVETLEQGKGGVPARLVLEPIALRTWCNGQPNERAIDARIESAEIAQLPEGDDADQIDRSADSATAFGAMLFGLPGAAAGRGAGASSATAHAVSGRVVNARLGEGARLKISIEGPVRVRNLACTTGRRAF